MFKDMIKKILGCLHRDISQNEVSFLDDRQEPGVCKQWGHVNYLINLLVSERDFKSDSFKSTKMPWPESTQT